MDTPSFCKLENVFILFLLLIIADFPEEMYSLWIKGGQGKKKKAEIGWYGIHMASILIS